MSNSANPYLNETSNTNVAPTTSSNPVAQKPKKRGRLGGLVKKMKGVGLHAADKVIDIAHTAKEIIVHKDEQSTTEHQRTSLDHSTSSTSSSQDKLNNSTSSSISNTEQSVEVPREIARAWGEALWTPIQSSFSQPPAPVVGSNISSTTPSNTEQSVEVPREIAKAWGEALWTPIQASLPSKSSVATNPSVSVLKSTLNEALERSHHLGVTGELRNEPSQTSLDISQPSTIPATKDLEETIHKAQAIGEEKSQIRDQQFNQSKIQGGAAPPHPSSLSKSGNSFVSAADFLKANLRKVREKGEQFGTTSPRMTRSANIQTSAQSIQTSLKSSSKSGEHPAGMSMADFVKDNLQNVRQKGCQFGTVSPQKAAKKHAAFAKSSQPSPAFFITAPDFLRETIREARLKGEQFGTTSPRTSKSFSDSSMTNLRHGQNQDSKMAADFLNQNISKARQIGERMGTTSPHLDSAIHSKSSNQNSAASTANASASSKSGFDILKETVHEARRLGEKMGTTSPRIESELQSQHKFQESQKKIKLGTSNSKRE